MAPTAENDDHHIEIRYWAAIRAAAHCKQETLEIPDPVSASALADRLIAQHAAPDFTRVLKVCSMLVDGQPVSPSARRSTMIHPGQTVEFLPPFAGG